MPIIDSQIKYSIGMLSYISDLSWNIQGYDVSTTCNISTGGTDFDYTETCKLNYPIESKIFYDINDSVSYRIISTDFNFNCGSNLPSPDDFNFDNSSSLCGFNVDTQWELLRNFKSLDIKTCYAIISGVFNLSDECYPKGLTDFELASCKCRFDVDVTYEVQNLPVINSDISWSLEPRLIFTYSVDIDWSTQAILTTSSEWKVISQQISIDSSWIVQQRLDSSVSWQNQQRFSNEVNYKIFDNLLEYGSSWIIQQRLDVDTAYKIWDIVIDLSTEWILFLDIKNSSSWSIQQRLDVDTTFGIHNAPFFNSLEYKIFNGIEQSIEARVQQRLESVIEHKIFDPTFINDSFWSIQQTLDSDISSVIWATPISFSVKWYIGFQPIDIDTSWIVQQRLDVDTDYHIFDPLNNSYFEYTIVNGISDDVTYSIQNKLDADIEWINRYGEINYDTTSKIYNGIVSETIWKLFNTGFGFVTEYRIWDGILSDVTWNIVGNLIVDTEWIDWNGFGSDESYSIQQIQKVDTEWKLRYGKIDYDSSYIIQQRLNIDTSSKIFSDYKYSDISWKVFDTGFGSDIEWKRAYGFDTYVMWMDSHNLDNYDVSSKIQNKFDYDIDYRIFDPLVEFNSSWVLLDRDDHIIDWKIVNVDNYPTDWKLRYGEVNQEVEWIDWEALEVDVEHKVFYLLDYDIEWINWNGHGSDESYSIENRMNSIVEHKVFHSLDVNTSYSVQQCINSLTDWKLRYGEVNQDTTYGMLTGFDEDVEHIIIGGFDNIIDYRITSSILNTNIGWTINTLYLDMVSSWMIYPENYIEDVAVSDFLGWRITSYNKSISEIIRDNKIEDVEYFNLAEILNKKLDGDA